MKIEISKKVDFIPKNIYNESIKEYILELIKDINSKQEEKMKKILYKNLKSCWLSVCFFLCILSLGTLAFAEQRAESNIKAELVWSESDGANYQIFYSRFENKLWSTEVSITHSDSSNILPCIGKDTDGVVWVVWSVVDGIQSQLFYSQSDGGTWSQPALIPTGFTSNTAPSVVVTSDNVVHIVWSGFDGKVDNIYHISRKGNLWSKPQKVNLDNAVPDILPIIGMNDAGNLWVYWSGYDGGGKYRNYSSIRNGLKWEGETEENVSDNVYLTMIKKVASQIPALPQSVSAPAKSSIYLENKRQIQSLPLRYLK
jgi:hypothetical protein